ncbi:MAG TPA: hypothetical protein VFV28_08835 [Limnobacter sp.]|nr:hypothetical protein [Limnobacter sp.]
MNSLDLSGFQLKMGSPCLLRASRGIEVDPQALNQQAPSLSQVMGKILQQLDAGQLLLGLNELFGSASEYAITGSTALAIHQHLANSGAVARAPGDLDVVVSNAGLQRLSSIDFSGAATLGFSCGPAEKESLTWRSPGQAELKVDVISSSNRAAGVGFHLAEFKGGVRVMPLNILEKSLISRAENGECGPHQEEDLHAIQQLMHPV